MTENGSGAVKVFTPQSVAETHAGGLLPQTGNATAAKEQTRAIAEVQAAMLIARMNPRNEAEAIEKIKNSCQRQSLAARARYSYPKGGTEVKGATIHILTACAGHWGNMNYGWREVERHLDYSKCLAFAWDLEGNVKTETEFDVPHVIDTKQGPKKMRDQRDIYELCANMAARRVRSCLERIIPRDVVDEALAECDNTLRASFKDLPKAIANMLNAFEEFGVTRAQIEKRMGRKAESLTAAQVIRLSEIYTSLKDEMSDSSDWFDQSTPSVAEQVRTEASNSKTEMKSVFDRDSALTEIADVQKTLGFTVQLKRNESIGSWSGDACHTVAELYTAPDEIVETTLKAARAALQASGKLA